MEKNVLYNKKTWDVKVITSFAISLISIGMGFYKMFIYDTYTDKNVYVGGDAYNYIINANLSTAFFVLALIFAIIACSFLIYNAIMIQGEHKNIEEKEDV